jgi:hypothetical protein
LEAKTFLHSLKSQVSQKEVIFLQKKFFLKKETNKYSLTRQSFLLMKNMKIQDDDFVRKLKK